MNKFVIDGSWNEIKGKLRQRYATLTDADLSFSEGKSEETLGRIQRKLGMSAAELTKVLSETKASLDSEPNGKGRYAEAKSKAAEIASDVKLRAGEVADDVRQAASVKAEELRLQASEAYQNARVTVRGYREDGEEYVRHNPRQALVTALAAGFVVGLLWRR